MSLQRARTVEEYVEWVKQAVFEVDDLRDCLEFELEDLARFPTFLDPLEKGIKELYQSMLEGRYVYGREDLPFMDLVERYAEQIPFNGLIKQINETHRRGLSLASEQA